MNPHPQSLSPVSKGISALDGFCHFLLFRPMGKVAVVFQIKFLYASPLGETFENLTCQLSFFIFTRSLA